ncbi:MAG: metal-dependent hydrolase [Anaerolineae bacterium]
MQTYSHFIITASLNRFYRNKSSMTVHTSALLLGSVLPDVPLVLLSALYFVDRWQAGTLNDGGLFGIEYDTLYFSDPVWVTGHALFHAPLLILLYLLIGYWFGVRGRQSWARALFWLGVGCGLHSVIDILTHHNDGPLLLFPFDWSTRFSSPVSYWDPRHHGDSFALFEHVLNLILLGSLWVSWRRSRQVSLSD